MIFSFLVCNSGSNSLYVEPFYEIPLWNEWCSLQDTTAYLKLPEAASKKVASRLECIECLGCCLGVIKEYFICDTHTAYGRTLSKADFELAIINVNICCV